ncbi:hypothetical protein BOX15_Mlig032445g1 [Macrostomum lignano]|uniref:U2A'/phosphoprotein 32 family A C-terminal domain-containing protein n=1 Tax=Macrostomum lignano TaxID=282301 RepID=A0A267FDD5_9PLAT|nr:hypothetical protein BOX15_Mlig032445g1 [Macrostomum lignano]
MESSGASNSSSPGGTAPNSSPSFTPPIKSEQLPVGKKLTKDLVLSKSKGGSLIEIKKIVVWGQKITDCSIVTEIPELEVASMNANKISSLEPFGQCPNLRELFLRSNCIEDLQEIFYLKDLPNLQVLWLAGNPCTKNPKYRCTIVRNLEQLLKLDDMEISPEERARSESDGLLFEQPPARPTAVEPAVASEPPLLLNLAEQMRPAEDVKLNEAAVSPPEEPALRSKAAESAAGTGDAEASSAEPSKPAPAPTTSADTPVVISESSAAANSMSPASRPSTAAAAGVVAPLPRYAMTEVRTAVLRLIRLLDQESLQLVMHTVRARLQEGAGATPDQQQPPQTAASVSPSFSLDNL